MVIEKILENDDWTLNIWKAHYGSGFWILLAHKNYIKDICDITAGRNQECYIFENYIYNDGKWLPIVKGETIINALDQLETKLLRLGNKINSEWMEDVNTVFVNIAIKGEVKKHKGYETLGIGISLAEAIKNDKSGVFKLQKYI